MSLMDFPSLNTQGRPYIIQEHNGKVVTGTEEEFLAVNKCRLLLDYPSIDKSQLSGLRHCISKDNMKNVFANGEGGMLDSAWTQFTNEGFSGVMKKVTDAAEPTRLWPLAKIGRGVLKMHNGMSSLAAKVLSKGDEKVEEIMELYGETLNWKSNWIRCLAIHPSGSRIAVCQPDDYIRIYPIGGKESRTPITLKHDRQENVSCMDWEPHDQRVLAVAAGGSIVIWKIAGNTRECVKIIDIGISCITSMAWDKMSSRGVLVASPESNKLMTVDTLTDEKEYITTWSWGSGNITRVVPTSDGKRIAAIYNSGNFKIFDRVSWDGEKISTKGRVLDAVWSPSGEALIFASEGSYYLQSVTFSQSKSSQKAKEGEKKWFLSGPPSSIFDLTPVEFDSSETDIQGGEPRPLIEIGGKLQRLVLSPDGKRLAVSFKKFSEVVATFFVEFTPTPVLTPCALIEAPSYGSASIVNFLPKFNEGSLLSIIWSEGFAQYVPFVYNHNASMVVLITNILDEISTTSSFLPNGSRRRSINDSLRSSDLPSGIFDQSDEQEDELLTEKIKKKRRDRSIPL